MPSSDSEPPHSEESVSVRPVAISELDDIVSYGIAHDIFDAEQARAITQVIATEAKAINEAYFGPFFGSLQILLGRVFILAVARMYEVEDKYPLRSVPAAIRFLNTRRS